MECNAGVPAEDVRRGVRGHVRVHRPPLPRRQAYQAALLGSRYVYSCILVHVSSVFSPLLAFHRYNTMHMRVLFQLQMVLLPAPK